MGVRSREDYALLLGTPAGFPGAVSSLARQDEYKVAAAHKIGGAILNVELAFAGIPARSPIHVGPRTQGRVLEALMGQLFRKPRLRKLIITG